MTDLTLPSHRRDRDALADRTDVLDKVGALALLPGDVYATTDLVAAFYGVDRNVIEQTVSRSRDELDSDGYRVVTRSEFETDIASVSSLDQYVRRVALFPRRAILRVGMLLRDSAVAKQVRTYLLDAERHATGDVDIDKIDRSMLARWVIEAEDRAKAAEVRALQSEATVVALAPAADAWKTLIERAGSRTQTVSEAASALSEHPQIQMGRNRLFNFMAERMGWLFRDGKGDWTPYQWVKDQKLLTYPLAPDEARFWSNQVHVTPKGFHRLYVELTLPFVQQPALPTAPRTEISA